MIMSLVQPKEGVLNGVNNKHEDQWYKGGSLISWTISFQHKQTDMTGKTTQINRKTDNSNTKTHKRRLLYLRITKTMKKAGKRTAFGHGRLFWLSVFFLLVLEKVIFLTDSLINRLVHGAEANHGAKRV
jgi:hypothetical protein